MENLRKFKTAGHLVYLRPCLPAGYLFTALKKRINPEAEGNRTHFQCSMKKLPVTQDSSLFVLVT